MTLLVDMDPNYMEYDKLYQSESLYLLKLKNNNLVLRCLVWKDMSLWQNGCKSFKNPINTWKGSVFLKFHYKGLDRGYFRQFLIQYMHKLERINSTVSKNTCDR